MVLLAVVAGAAAPGYSHLSQFISELGARGTRYEVPVRFLGFLPAGFLLLSFCFFAARTLPRSKLTRLALIGLAIYAAGYVVAAVFPCDPGCRPTVPSLSQAIHNVCGFAGYLLAPGFLFILARQARSWPVARHVDACGYVASGLSLIGLFLLDPSSPVAGLGQRLLEGSVLVWSVICGYAISRQPASPAPSR